MPHKGACARKGTALTGNRTPQLNAANHLLNQNTRLLWCLLGCGEWIRYHPSMGSIDLENKKPPDFSDGLSSNEKWIRYHPSMGSIDLENKKPPDFSDGLSSSGEWIRTTDLRVMSNAPESVPFVRRVLQIS
jgi:hypothetical protein